MPFSPLRIRQRSEAAASDTGGDACAELFVVLLRELEPGLRRYMGRQLADADAAEDAVQETFLRMLRYRQRSDGGEVRALLFRVAASVVADHRRQARTKQADRHCSIESTDVASPEAQPDRVLSDRQNLACIKEAIRQLPPHCRQVFLLHRFDGMSYRDIARRFGVSERTVENQIAHALAVCRRALGEYRGRTFK
ncbi:hypothetical protein ASG87_05125 [Frateuria sp. Soil773]|uniref:RNA polymerase sigma factor n=1 Tax=Frateuria sp. Soil773 TaxID=1736407 RepID=UPI0006F5EFD6|nr:RNA polymerase sigma factor [Frateuria sp. Soil773]KRE88944.1 hypothetical protein ASG87_05125 [Frateuria sp. Soil773]